MSLTFRSAMCARNITYPQPSACRPKIEAPYLDPFVDVDVDLDLDVDLVVHVNVVVVLVVPVDVAYGALRRASRNTTTTTTGLRLRPGTAPRLGPRTRGRRGRISLGGRFAGPRSRP